MTMVSIEQINKIAIVHETIYSEPDVIKDTLPDSNENVNAEEEVDDEIDLMEDEDDD